jgi:hypothetical protein
MKTKENINDTRKLRRMIFEIMSENPNLMPMVPKPEDAEIGDDDAPDSEEIQSPEELISKIKDMISAYEAAKDTDVEPENSGDTNEII